MLPLQALVPQKMKIFPQSLVLLSRIGSSLAWVLWALGSQLAEEPQHCHSNLLTELCVWANAHSGAYASVSVSGQEHFSSCTSFLYPFSTTCGRTEWAESTSALRTYLHRGSQHGKVVRQD